MSSKTKWNKVCWQELVNGLTNEKMLFFIHHHTVSPGCPEPTAVSICTDKLGGIWQIFLYPNGKWELK
jgi:hypothetical protein